MATTAASDPRAPAHLVIVQECGDRAVHPLPGDARPGKPITHRARTTDRAEQDIGGAVVAAGEHQVDQLCSGQCAQPAHVADTGSEPPLRRR